jgi:hypothetical protein
VTRAELDRRITDAERGVKALVRSLLPEPALDPADPMALMAYLTCTELSRLEATFRGAAEGEVDGDQAAAAWDDTRRRAVARMLTGVDGKALGDREFDGRVLVQIPPGEPALPGRTRLVAYLPDQTVPDLWHVEPVYRGVLPRTLTTAELAKHDPMPWPPRMLR